MKMIGSVIMLKRGADEEYERLHKNVWPEVLLQIRRSNIINYSIFKYERRNETFLFSYFEYVGADFATDMKKMADDPKTQEWWRLTDPLQERVPEAKGGEWWHELQKVF